MSVAPRVVVGRGGGGLLKSGTNNFQGIVVAEINHILKHVGRNMGVFLELGIGREWWYRYRRNDGRSVKDNKGNEGRPREVDSRTDRVYTLFRADGVCVA